MPSKHKFPLIGWRSEDATLKQWISDQAEKAGITVREYLDRVLADHRKQVEQKSSTTEKTS